MATKKAEAVDYQALNQELETIMDELQRDDLDIDQALKQYERGLELVKILQAYLTTAENTVQVLRLKFTPNA